MISAHSVPYNKSDLKCQLREKLDSLKKKNLPTIVNSL